MADIIRDIFPDGTQDEIRKLTPVIYSYEDEYLSRTGGKLYPGIIEAMRSIYENVPVFIVSNCQEGYIELFMDKTGCADCVRAHLCPGDTGLFKADNIRKIISDHSLSHPVYVGDTIMDRDACEDADCPFIYAAYGFGKINGCKYIIEKPSDLTELFEYCK